MKPELIKFVSGTKAKASEVNENFEKILNYAETASAIVSFDIESTYKYGQWVLGEVDGKSGIYESLVEENKGHTLSDQEFWAKVKMGGGAGLEIGDIGIAPLGVDETEGKRRYLNGSIIIQDQYKVFSEKVKLAVKTYAGLGCIEEEWQNIASKSVGGQCGKFVIDDEAGTIRLPKIIMPIQGLTDLTKLGEIVEAGLPNLWGRVGNLGINNDTIAEGVFSTTRDGSGSLPAGGTTPYTATFDASTYNSAYGNSDTVQQEQIQYPYFIQVATGAEYEEDIINEIELNNPFVLLEGEYFTAPVYNASWLQSNEGFTGSLALHPTAYNALLVEYNSDVEVGTTVDNYTKRGLSVKLNTEDYTDYDFVLNTTSQTFRCPLKLKISCGGTAPVLTGEENNSVSGNNLQWLRVDGSGVGNTGNQTLGIGPNGNTTRTKTDSFGSQSADLVPANLYADLSQATNEGLYLYFYVGETLQNAHLVNVGRIEEKLSECITRNDCKAYIVETYHDGTSWYRVWSPDVTGKKWCEQGGRGEAPNNSTGAQISLLKTMADTSYTVIAVQLNLGGGYNIGVGTLTTSSFNVRANSNASVGAVSWYVCGYIA